MSHLDYLAGRRHADDLLTASGSTNLQAVLYGLSDWRRKTAQHLVDTATQRSADGVNPDYQRGVIERAKEYLK